MQVIQPRSKRRTRNMHMQSPIFPSVISKSLTKQSQKGGKKCIKRSAHQVCKFVGVKKEKENEIVVQV